MFHYQPQLEGVASMWPHAAVGAHRNFYPRLDRFANTGGMIGDDGARFIDYYLWQRARIGLSERDHIARRHQGWHQIDAFRLHRLDSLIIQPNAVFNRSD